MPHEAPQDRLIQPEVDIQARLASAKRLKSAWTSFIMSGLLTLVFVALAAFYFIRIATSTTNHAQTTGIAVIGGLYLLRLGYRSYRMYNTWRSLREAQQAHRSL